MRRAFTAMALMPEIRDFIDAAAKSVRLLISIGHGDTRIPRFLREKRRHIARAERAMPFSIMPPCGTLDCCAHALPNAHGQLAPLENACRWAFGHARWVQQVI